MGFYRKEESDMLTALLTIAFLEAVAGMAAVFLTKEFALIRILDWTEDRDHRHGSRPVFCIFIITVSYGRGDVCIGMGGCYGEEGKVGKETLEITYDMAKEIISRDLETMSQKFVSWIP